tara:strand:+ start:281 stop:1153 length:873 start_codon:yes stop_codon:yes gene_type:complete
MNKKKHLIVTFFLLVGTIAGVQPIKAFAPYVYEPNKKELNRTGINIGKTAAQLLHLGQTKDAIRIAELAVKLNPTDDRLWSILAEAQVRNNLLEEAIISISKAKELKPKKAGLWFAEASLNIQSNKPKVAIYLINQGLRLQPKNANGYFQLGNARIMLEEFKKAFKAFKKATDINPKFWEALNNQGLVLFEMDQRKEAVKTWRQVITINSNAESILALAVGIYIEDQTNQEAFSLAQEALIKNPDYVYQGHQKDQLWGKKLQQATQKLLTNPKLASDIERAIANSEFIDD